MPIDAIAREICQLCHARDTTYNTVPPTREGYQSMLDASNRIAHLIQSIENIDISEFIEDLRRELHHVICKLRREGFVEYESDLYNLERFIEHARDFTTVESYDFANQHTFMIACKIAYGDDRRWVLGLHTPIEQMWRYHFLPKLAKQLDP